MPKRKTTEQFINDVRNLYGDKYDCSNVEYSNKNTKVCIICPEHGEFYITPNNFLNGHGCSKCNGGVKLTVDKFIEKAKQIHGDKYDYSKVEYVNAHTKVCIICQEHGEFWQIPNDHLNGVGCPRCANLKK